MSPIETLQPQVRALAIRLLELAAAERILLKVTSGLRTYEEQSAIYAKGRRAPGEPCRHQGDSRPRRVGSCTTHPLGLRVTNARPGYSWHNFGLAFDVAIVSYDGDTTPRDLYDGPWQRVGALGESIGLEWGGRWARGADLPHFQLNEGMTLASARSQWPTGYQLA